MRVKYCHKIAPMTVFCRRAGKPRQVQSIRRCIKQQNLIVQVLEGSLCRMVPQLARLLAIYPAKTDIFQESAPHLERR